MNSGGGNELNGIAQLVPLFRELSHLKRIRVPGLPGSVAQRVFERAWTRLVGGEDLESVALQETAHAVAATKLAGIDAAVLADGGVDEAARLAVFQRAFDAAAVDVPGDLAGRLREALSAAPFAAPEVATLPTFVSRLAAQPRAGATRPGHPRVVLEPAENHAEHCAVVAVNAVLASGCFGGDAATAFLTGLSHHLHNAYLPDAGDAGDVLLGEFHGRLMDTFRRRALSELPGSLGEAARASLDAVYRADFAEARCFQAADSLDRVLEMEWHARSAQFTLDTALQDMDIIHPGPVQAFQLEIMRSVGWLR